MSAVDMAKTLASIHPTLNYASVADAQIVVEAVVENPKVKPLYLLKPKRSLLIMLYLLEYLNNPHFATCQITNTP
nr:hypothetical protein [Proteus mirabilis]